MNTEMINEKLYQTKARVYREGHRLLETFVRLEPGLSVPGERVYSTDLRELLTQTYALQHAVSYLLGANDLVMDIALEQVAPPVTVPMVFDMQVYDATDASAEPARPGVVKRIKWPKKGKKGKKRK